MKPAQNKADKTIDVVVPLALIDGHERNYNQHPEAQVARLAKSVRVFGQVRGIVGQWQPSGRYLLLAGHGVVEGLRAEGVTEARMALVPDSWSAAKCLAYLAADNELSAGAVKDQQALAAIVQEVALSDDDLALLAAGTEEALRAFTTAGEMEDKAPPEEFAEAGEGIATEYQCPKCQYAWSGRPK